MNNIILHGLPNSQTDKYICEKGGAEVGVLSETLLFTPQKAVFSMPRSSVSPGKRLRLAGRPAIRGVLCPATVLLYVLHSASVRHNKKRLRQKLTFPTQPLHGYCYTYYIIYDAVCWAAAISSETSRPLRLSHPCVPVPLVVRQP